MVTNWHVGSQIVVRCTPNPVRIGSHGSRFALLVDDRRGALKHQFERRNRQKTSLQFLKAVGQGQGKAGAWQGRAGALKIACN